MFSDVLFCHLNRSFAACQSISEFQSLGVLLNERSYLHLDYSAWCRKGILLVSKRTVMVLLFNCRWLKMALIRMVYLLLRIYRPWRPSSCGKFMCHIIVLTVFGVNPVKELSMALHLLLDWGFSKPYIQCHLVFDTHSSGDPNLSHYARTASLNSHNISELKGLIVHLMSIVYYGLLRRDSHRLNERFLISKLQRSKITVFKTLRAGMLGLEMAGWILRYFRNLYLFHCLTFEWRLKLFGKGRLFLSWYYRSIIILNGFFVGWSNYFGQKCVSGFRTML
jgi:hypothetical protein